MKWYEEVCPKCGEADITMIGDPEFNDEWECNICNKTFPSFKTIEHDTKD